MVTRWKDSRLVTLSIFMASKHWTLWRGGHDPNERLWPSRSERKFVDITQPYVIDRYNRHMGGVDRMDQNVSTYRISIRSRKWWWALFAYLLDVAMQNAWLLYRNTAAAIHQPLDQLEFRRNVCAVYYKRYSRERAAIGRPLGRPRPVKDRVPSDVRTDKANHFLESSGTQRRCGVCGLKARRICRKCDIGLHKNCFLYSTSRENCYWELLQDCFSLTLIVTETVVVIIVIFVEKHLDFLLTHLFFQHFSYIFT